jgi:hypothetical protein
MAFTRDFDDDCRIEKNLQQSTDQGRWILNVPGNGSNPAYMADPHIRIQTWGGNLMTNCVNLESELRGYNKPIGHDCLGKDEYKRFNVSTQAIQYPTNHALSTEESRAIMPAWTARDSVEPRWAYLPLNPQENTCFPFQNNLSTRILEKEYFVPKIPCIAGHDDLRPRQPLRN